MRIIAIVLLAVSLQGCASLVPNTIALEQDHVSHISQHFGDHPTNFGYDSVNVVARWQQGNAYAEVSEGITIGGSQLDRMREVFDARIGYAIPLK